MMRTDDDIRRVQLVESTMVRQQIAALSSALRQKHEAEITAYLQAVRAWERRSAFYPRAPGFLAAAGKLPVVAPSAVKGRNVPTQERDVPAAARTSDDSGRVSLYGVSLD